MNKARSCSVGLLLTLLLTSCLTSRPGSSALQLVAQDQCQVDSSNTSGYVFRPVPVPPGSLAESVLTNRYGPRALRMAQAIGLPPLLVTLTTLERQEPEGEHSAAYWAVRQQISDQLQLASADIATASALLDCDTKRATLTAALLTRQENRREKQLTITAITIGAVAIIGASFLNRHERPAASDWLNLAGGASEGGLGILALCQLPPRVRYPHARNPLRDVWERPPHATEFAPLVWYYLNQPKVETTQPSVSELRGRWEVLTSLSTGKKPEVNYFGTGDSYDAEALTLRATMLGQLETEVRLMNNDLTILLNEIVAQSRRPPRER